MMKIYLNYDFSLHAVNLGEKKTVHIHIIPFPSFLPRQINNNLEKKLQ